MWPYHYTKSGGLCGRFITPRGGVCVAASFLQERGFVWPYLYTKRGVCARITTLRGEVCEAVSVH